MARIAGQNIILTIEAREGVLYFTNEYVYKVFFGEKNGVAYDVLDRYKNAESFGIPVPDTTLFRASLELGGEIKEKDVEGVRSAKIFGRFFQLSKPGAESVLINEVTAATNRGLLKYIIDGMVNAQDHGLADPQGFINCNSNPSICFIDVHFNVPHTKFEQVIRYANQIRWNGYLLYITANPNQVYLGS